MSIHTQQIVIGVLAVGMSILKVEDANSARVLQVKVA